MVGTTKGEPTGVEEPLQIPPTRAPRRKRKPWSRRKRTVTAILVVIAVGLSASLFVDREVDRRLDALPIVTTTSSIPPTTAIVSPEPDTPRRTRSRSRPAPVTAVTAVEQTTTTTTEATVKGEVAESGYDIIQKLDALPVREERSFGYTRYRFGLWNDEDNDYCSTREDILIREAVRPVSKTPTCSIVSGTWKSPYDDLTVNDPDGITVDHVVGLYEAWKSGAWDWTDEQRNQYKNDIEHVEAIRAVSDESRDEKDGRDPSDWLPSSASFRCQYLQTWVDMKTVWKLAVDAGERESIAAAALSC